MIKVSDIVLRDSYQLRRDDKGDKNISNQRKIKTIQNYESKNNEQVFVNKDKKKKNL